jgi:hypothetical protein
MSTAAACGGALIPRSPPARSAGSCLPGGFGVSRCWVLARRCARRCPRWLRAISVLPRPGIVVWKRAAVRGGGQPATAAAARLRRVARASQIAWGRIGARPSGHRDRSGAVAPHAADDPGRDAHARCRVRSHANGPDHATGSAPACGGRRSPSPRTLGAGGGAGCSRTGLLVARTIARRVGRCRGTVQRALTAGASRSGAPRARPAVPRGHDVRTLVRRPPPSGVNGGRAAGVTAGRSSTRGARRAGSGSNAAALRGCVAWRGGPPGPHQPGRHRGGPAGAALAPAPPRRRVFAARQTRWSELASARGPGRRRACSSRAARCQERATMAGAQALVDQVRPMVRMRARWGGCLVDSGKRGWPRCAGELGPRRAAR